MSYIRTEEQKEQLRNLRRGVPHTEETKQKLKDSWTDEMKEKQRGKRKYFKHTSETKQKLKDINTGDKNKFYGKKHSEETRKRMSESAKQRCKRLGAPKTKRIITKEERQSWINKATATMNTPEWRASHPRKRDRYIGENNPNWKGGKSFEPYCVLFNKEFRERVRGFFKYRCVECGKPQSELKKKLFVHHVNYDKMVCCNTTNPLFVCLCNSCHSKTNGKNKRLYWEERYTNLIMNEYNGKSYLPKKE